MRPLLHATLAIWGVVNVVTRWAVMPRARFRAWADRMEVE